MSLPHSLTRDSYLMVKQAKEFSIKIHTFRYIVIVAFIIAKLKSLTFLCYHQTVHKLNSSEQHKTSLTPPQNSMLSLSQAPIYEIIPMYTKLIKFDKLSLI